MKKTLLIIAGSALVTSLAIKAAPAFAETTSGDTATSIVRTSDLDLSSELGQRTLDRRLVVAAHQVCDDPSAVDLKAANAESQCRDQVLSAARVRAGVIAGRNSGEPIRIAIAR